jgi:hypothetical protein
MITHYVIYGERHSGTKFLEKLITYNFNLTKDLTFGHKHFFRPKHIFNSCQDILDKTLFLCIVRNPYDWIMACHKLRHHCSIHGASNIYSFISKEWSSREEFVGPEILADRHLYADRRYKNIFEMRWAKINYLVNILPNYIHNYIFVRYEDFLLNNFTENFLTKLQYRFSLNYKKEPPEIEKFKNKYYYDKIDYTLLKYINNSLRWDIENQIGYIKASSVDELQNIS